jgi:hypothetical protein
MGGAVDVSIALDFGLRDIISLKMGFHIGSRCTALRDSIGELMALCHSPNALN